MRPTECQQQHGCLNGEAARADATKEGAEQAVDTAQLDEQSSSYRRRVDADDGTQHFSVARAVSVPLQADVAHRLQLGAGERVSVVVEVQQAALGRVDIQLDLLQVADESGAGSKHVLHGADDVHVVDVRVHGDAVAKERVSGECIDGRLDVQAEQQAAQRVALPRSQC